MRTQLINIGNSKGVRLPKKILELINIKDDIDLDVIDGAILIRPIKNEIRKDWAQAFLANREEIQAGSDDFAENEFDKSEWQW